MLHALCHLAVNVRTARSKQPENLKAKTAVVQAMRKQHAKAAVGLEPYRSTVKVLLLQHQALNSAGGA